MHSELKIHFNIRFQKYMTLIIISLAVLNCNKELESI